MIFIFLLIYFSKL